jgi:hypothetical protein
MSKKAIIRNIDFFSKCAADSINQRLKHPNTLRDWYEGRISAYGMAAATLAGDLGIASELCRKPAALRAAA